MGVVSREMGVEAAMWQQITSQSKIMQSAHILGQISGGIPCCQQQEKALLHLTSLPRFTITNQEQLQLPETGLSGFQKRI